MVCDDCFETEECRCGPGEMCGVCFESRDPECEHPNKQYTGAVYDGPAGRKTFLYYTCPDCKAKLKEEEPKRLSLTAACACSHVNNWHVRADHNDTHCAASDCPCGAFRASSEPEERNLGPDGMGCVFDACPRDPDECEHGCREAADELTRMGQEMEPPEGAEYTPCVCGHIVPEHSDALFRHCLKPGCACQRYRQEEPPPQPERRPPYVVAYSVQGHLFEVALSGDATVRAVDGALVIQHHLGPVAGIVQVLPVLNKESDAQADH